MDSQKLSEITSNRIAPPKTVQSSKLNWLGVAMLALGGAEALLQQNILPPGWTAGIGAAIIVLRTFFTGGVVAGFKSLTKPEVAEALSRIDPVRKMLEKLNVSTVKAPE